MQFLSIDMPNMRVFLMAFSILALSMIRSIFWGLSMHSLGFGLYPEEPGAAALVVSHRLEG